MLGVSVIAAWAHSNLWKVWSNIVVREGWVHVTSHTLFAEFSPWLWFDSFRYLFLPFPFLISINPSPFFPAHMCPQAHLALETPTALPLWNPSKEGPQRRAQTSPLSKRGEVGASPAAAGSIYNVKKQWIHFRDQSTWWTNYTRSTIFPRPRSLHHCSWPNGSWICLAWLGCHDQSDLANQGSISSCLSLN